MLLNNITSIKALIKQKYFNKSKSAGAHKTIPVEDLEDLKNRILLGEFTKPDKKILSIYIKN